MRPWGYLTGWVGGSLPGTGEVVGAALTIDDLTFRVLTADRLPDGSLQLGLGPRVKPAAPGMDGPTCRDCGGMTVRTGTCATCTSCGSTTGCG